MTTITLTSEIVYNDHFQQLTREKKLSQLIQRLLREHLNIMKEAVPEGEDLGNEMMKLQIRLARLKEKEAEIKKATEEERKKWKITKY
jgi:hypothetical protein